MMLICRRCAPCAPLTLLLDADADMRAMFDTPRLRYASALLRRAALMSLRFAAAAAMIRHTLRFADFDDFHAVSLYADV